MKRSYIILILLVLVAAASAVYLATLPSEPAVPKMTSPELFAVIEDTDGLEQTPSNAEGITTDSNGNIYVGLLAERAVVKISQNGEQSVFARIPGEGSLLGLAVDDEDNVYIADANFADPMNSCDCVRKITPEGDVTVFVSGISVPNGLVFDENGNLLVTSSFQGVVYKIDRTGNMELFLEHDLIKSHNPQFGFGANGIAISDDGTIYVANTGDSNIIRIKGDEVSIFGPAEGFPGADGLALDSAGNLYIAQNSANTISALTPTGEKIVIAQNADSDGSNGQLEAPASIAFFEDRLYVTNADFTMGTNTSTEPP